MAGTVTATSARVAAGSASVSRPARPAGHAVRASLAPLRSRSSLVAPGSAALRPPSPAGAASRRYSRPQQRGAGRTPLVVAKAKDPDALGLEGDDPNREPPNLLWRVFAATLYVIPWIDALTLGREIFHTFPQTISLYLLPSPFVNIYYANNFMPLIVFFLCFLAIVKNTKLHHFVRFNTMQAIMLDIIVMLFNILRAYFPAEIRWSVIMVYFDKFAFLACMATILYGVFWTLRGYYADLPFVSEAVYIQVEASEYS